MLEELKIEGSIVALVTPMLDDGSIDYPALAGLIEMHITSGTTAIVMVGTTGESATLSVEEHFNIIEKAVELSSGRIPIIAGTGANATAEAIQLTKTAKKIGAVAGLSVTPYYNKPTQTGLTAHYMKIADSVDFPLILYNVPSRTGVDIFPATVAELCKHKNIIGIKEASADIGRIIKLRSIIDKSLYSGDDMTFFDSMKNGANGVISVTANVAPHAMATVCSMVQQEKWQEAEDINKKMTTLHSSMFIESNPIPVKWALHQMNKIKNNLRLPLTPLSPNHHSSIMQALQENKII